MGNRLAIEILMDPTNANVLVAATDNGIYRTTNAGANWTLVKTGGYFKDMQLKFGTTNTLFAVTSSEFWKSNDFGLTWTQITAGVVIPGGGSGNGSRSSSSVDAARDQANAEMEECDSDDDQSDQEETFKSPKVY
jgi:hypothetical protein